jgi:hypothetical protein
MFLVGLATGIAVAAIAALAVITLRHSSTWQEKSVQAQAQSLGCGLSVGLGHGCVPVEALRSTGPGVWTAVYGTRRRVCYTLRPLATPPHRRGCR